MPPPEIYLRGPRALKAYNKARKEGKTRVRRIPLMLIGQARSGKTSLKKSLQGIPFNPDEDRTVGIDVDLSLFKVTTETWKIGKGDQATNKEAKSCFESNCQVMKNLKHEDHLPKTETEAQIVSERNEVNRDSPGTSSTIFGQDASSVNSPARTHSKAGKDDNHAFETTVNYKSYPKETTERHDPLSPQKTLKKIESLLGDSVDEVESEDDIYSVLWDFAGESVYYETHTLFLTSRAIFLLAYDLSQDPDEIAQPVKRKGTFKDIEDRIGTKTNRDYLDYWMTSVFLASSQSKGHEVHPASASTVLPKTTVFLVCTHADQSFGGKNPRDLARKVYGELHQKHYEIPLYGPFEVDNTKSGECPGVSRLRKKIRKVAKELPQMKEFIPIRWLKFEKAFQDYLNAGHRWITIKDAKQIARRCQIHDDEEFKTALDFLHDQKFLLHFDNTDELNKFVFLDLQWLIDLMSKVITVEPYDDDEENEFMDLWCTLEKKGILEEKLLKHVWGELIEKDDVFKSLIEIMEKFSLLCSWPASDDFTSKTYLVPSMLRSYPTQDIMKVIDSIQLPSLFIKFEPGQVPLRLFPRLVTQFLLLGKDDFWSLSKFQLHQNFAQLYYSKEDNCCVFLLCHSSFIEVVVRGGNDSFEVSCFAQLVFGQLILILDCMRKEFFWLKSMAYQAGVICTVCCRGRKVNFCLDHRENDCEREECLHFIPESELRRANEKITCTNLPSINKVRIKDFSVWLGSCQKVIESGSDS